VGVAGGGGGEFGRFVDFGWRAVVRNVRLRRREVWRELLTWIADGIQLAFAGEPGFLDNVR
jgi:poly(3-hydroxyalkanoate) synthetase